MTSLGPVKFIAAAGEARRSNPFPSAPASVTVNGTPVSVTIDGREFVYPSALAAGDVVIVTPASADLRGGEAAATADVEIVPTAYAPTDKSGSTAAAGASSTIMAANRNRAYWRIQNLSTSVDLWFNDKGGAAAVNGVGCNKVAPGQMYEPPVNGVSNAAIAVASASSIAFEASEFTA